MRFIITKNLKAANGGLLFYCDRKNGVTEYRLTDFPSSDIKIFNISDYANVNIISTNRISGGECTFQSLQADSVATKYLAVTTSAYKEPKILPLWRTPIFIEFLMGQNILLLLTVIF